MIGGFLGAGKTTSIIKLAEYLTEKGQKVGLISNDQGEGLVDTVSMKSKNFAVEEIAGGCFCCRFNSLSEAADKLEKEIRPDVFLAEPVGSCTDLIATVSYPLRRIYGDRFLVAPLSIVLDPVRARRIFGLAEGRKFSPKVQYVYKKQLEEAEIIVINKIDLLESNEEDELEKIIRQEYPRAKVFLAGAREGRGLTEWFDYLLSRNMNPGQNLEINYDDYAEGEKALGWLNMTLDIRADRQASPDPIMLDLANRFRVKFDREGQEGREIAHFKMTMMSAEHEGDLSILSLVSTDRKPEMSQSALLPGSRFELVVNIRAEAEPDMIKKTWDQVLEKATVDWKFEYQEIHSEFFQPKRPEPVHREKA